MKAVQCDIFGYLKEGPEVAALLSTGPTAAPSADVLAAALATLPGAEALAKIAQTRWGASMKSAADHAAIADAFTKMQSAAGQKFLGDLLAQIKDLVSVSAGKYGHCVGEVYDDVSAPIFRLTRPFTLANLRGLVGWLCRKRGAWLQGRCKRRIRLIDAACKILRVARPLFHPAQVFGEGATGIAGYLPSTSHFQLYYHELVNSKALFASWEAALAGCGANLNADSAGIGFSASRRGYVFLLSLAQDIAFLRLCQALLAPSCTFTYA